MNDPHDHQPEAVVIVLLPVLLLGVGVFWISRQIGASFAVTLWTILWLVCSTAGAVGVGWLSRTLSLPVGTFLFLGWMSLWKLIDSIACSGCNPDAPASEYGLPYMMEAPWWDTSYFQWGVLLGLAVLTFILWRIEDSRSY